MNGSCSISPLMRSTALHSSPAASVWKSHVRRWKSVGVPAGTGEPSVQVGTPMPRPVGAPICVPVVPPNWKCIKARMHSALHFGGMRARSAMSPCRQSKDSYSPALSTYSAQRECESARRAWTFLIMTLCRPKVNEGRQMMNEGVIGNAVKANNE